MRQYSDMSPFQSHHVDLPVTDGLKHRRIRHHLRRLASATLVALCAYSLMQYLSTLSTDTVTLLVARHDIRRGDILDTSSLTQVQTPRSDALRGALTPESLTSESQGSHLTALIDIAKGQAIYRDALTSGIEAGHGLTKIRVRLASLPNDLQIGETVKLVTSGSCAPEDEPSTEDGTEQDAVGNDGAADGTSEEPCALSDEALVLSIPEDDEDSGLFSQVRDEEAVYNAVEFALPPRDALAVISRQSSQPILAVTTH